MTRKLTCFTCQFRDEQRTGAEICPANVSRIDTPWGRACQPLAIFFPVPKNRPRSLCESLLCPVSFLFQNRGIGDLYILRRVLQRVRDLAYSFFAYSQNIGSPESLSHFVSRKVSTVAFSEGGYTLSRSQNDKTCNIWYLVSVTSTFSLKLVVEWRRLPRFSAKMTLVRAHATYYWENLVLVVVLILKS